MFEELILPAVVGAAGAVVSIVVSARLGVDKHRTALVSHLKDRVALLEAENQELKDEVHRLEADNEALRLRVERLELTEDRRFSQRKRKELED